MPLTTGTPPTSSNAANLHDRMDANDSNMHFPKGYRSATNGQLLSRGADGNVSYFQGLLEAALDYVSGATTPPSSNEGDVYILSSSYAELTVSAIAWQSGTTVRYSFSGSPDLSSITTSDYFVISTAANSENNGRFEIDAVDNTSKYIEVTNGLVTDATLDESSVSFASDVSYRDWDGAIKNEWVKYYDSAEWYRVEPVEGVCCYVKDEDVIYTFDGSTWNSVGSFSDITMQNAYEGSSEPEILTDTTRGALSIRRGSASDTNYLVVFLNGSGTVTNAIDASGNVIWEDSSNLMKLTTETLTANRTHSLPNKSSSSIATEDDVATLTDGATITWDCRTGDNKTVTLGGNRTLSITNPRNGMVGILKVVQDGTGGRTLTLPSGSYVVDDGAGVIDMSGAAASEVWVLSFWYDGTNYYWNYSSNYTNV